MHRLRETYTHSGTEACRDTPLQPKASPLLLDGAVHHSWMSVLMLGLCRYVKRM